MPELSIVVPVYGVEAYLDTCMESLAAQTYEDFEVILVDDGSPDGCPAICDAWAERDPRVRVVHKENGGVSSARNAGIRLAKGRYLAFVDPDDHLVPEAFATAVAKMRAGDFQLVLYGVQVCREDGRIDHWRPPAFETGQISQLAPFMLSQPDMPNLLQVVINKLYLTQVIMGNDIFFDEEKRIYECDAFNYSYLAHIRRMATVPQPLYVVNRRLGSLTHTTTKDYYELLMGNVPCIKAFFKAAGGFEEIHDEWLRQRRIRGLRTQLFYLLDPGVLTRAQRRTGFAELAGNVEKRQLLLENMPRDTPGLRLAHFCLRHRLPGLLAATVALRNAMKKGSA